jgi:hypothetical protein
MNEAEALAQVVSLDGARTSREAELARWVAAQGVAHPAGNPKPDREAVERLRKGEAP